MSTTRNLTTQAVTQLGTLTAADITEATLFLSAVKAMEEVEKLHPRAPLDALLFAAWESITQQFLPEYRVVLEQNEEAQHTIEKVWRMALEDDATEWLAHRAEIKTMTSPVNLT